ncbi:hypothetical protein BKA67DRAFT_695577 [Truncatella angustata]|uniref:Uncharacterized protein n=1 Tax=Truncatella angustata TaxID=152316 RepID=A0A9P8RPV9_9PEZI|nr:uncharacterized protein BKA67DRAFT_695577 [Truncatella angustata]KAH6647126.1 hypothetical protein BKA67DRAFT_695577 [Truncatella angustata]
MRLNFQAPWSPRSTGKEPSLPPPFDNSGNGKLLVPGIGSQDFYELPREERFAHGANDFKQDPRLLAREIAMLGVMNSITDKADWNTKVFNEDIVEKWKSEALKMPLITENAWDWCLQEMRDKAKLFENNGRILVLDAQSMVCKSDTLVDNDLRNQLITSTDALRTVPESEQDWHPKSNDQVLNLVHPSLFPLVYGRTPVLSRGGQVLLDDITSYGNTEIAPAIEWPVEATWSRRFQWLPCEVQFDGSSSDVHITSYINNLHPIHKDAYAAIEKIIALSIDPWNDVLVRDRYVVRNKPRFTALGAEFDSEMPEWIDWSELEDMNRLKERDPERYSQVIEKIKEYIALPDINENREHEGEYEFPLEDPRNLEDDLSETVERKWKRLRTVIHPDVPSGSYEKWKKDQSGKSQETTPVDLRKDFREQGLQVIVKLSSIELTPENSAYSGGNWHIEGMLNEHIAATAIYYYDVDNVKESRISFRAEADLDSVEMSYQQNEHEPLAAIFGVESLELWDEPAIQNMGSVTTPQGRLLAFPNTLQHKVEPFELVDKTKPGHRRFLVLWLVDPHYRICSTRNAPPQQHEWWVPQGYDKVDFSAFPPEILNMVTDQVGQWPMGLDEAKQLRLELMEERTRGQEAVNNGFDTYNFCEH